MKYIFIFIIATLTLFANDFNQAVEDYKSGGYIKALNTFYTLAKKDDAKAQYNVGLIYANGKGVQKDLAKAKKWYEKAAKQGNGPAQYNLARLYHAAGKVMLMDMKKQDTGMKKQWKQVSYKPITISLLYIWKVKV